MTTSEEAMNDLLKREEDVHGELMMIKALKLLVSMGWTWSGSDWINPIHLHVVCNCQHYKSGSLTGGINCPVHGHRF